MNGHVAYKTQTDDALSNMVANILPTDTPLTPGVGSKCHTICFLKVVTLHITLKGNGIEYNECKYSVLIHTLGWGRKVIFVSFLKVVVLHIKLKRKKSRPTCKLNIDFTHTPDLWGLVERSDIDIVQISILGRLLLSSE